MRKRIRFAVFLLLILFSLFLILWLIAFSYARFNNFKSPPESIGNFESVRARVPPFDPEKVFSVGVCGDVRSDETFDALACELRKLDLAFLVILGDIAREPRPEQHRFLRFKMHKTWQLPFPVFLIPGNHDVDEKNFPLSLFSEVYGSPRFSIVRHPLRFIFLDMLPKRKSNSEALKFLEKELKEARSNKERTFVFGHGSPHVSPYVGGRSFEGEDRLIELLRRYGVEYYVGGDFHGYCRTRLDSTTFIATGGGGARLVYKNGFGFHHAVVLRIGPDRVAEQICVVPKKFSALHHAVYWGTIADEKIGLAAALLPGIALVLSIAIAFWIYRKRF